MFKRLITPFLIILLFVSSARAGWVDDWASQATSQGPSSFEGQKRNYYSGGYYSARYHASKDYLFSVNAPSIKMGCGGIDVMMGGFSFLKADEMVKKMEKIITSPAAAAFAFDMALGILCEPCKNSLNEMEKFVNALNSINLDDCKAAKSVATLITSPLKGKDVADTASKAIQQAIEDTGLYDSYKEASAAIKNVSEFGTRYKEWKQKQRDIGEASSSAMASEADDSVTKGSLIAKIYAKMAAKAGESFEPNYKGRAELVRAFIGDYKIKPITDASGFTAGEDAVTYIPQCDKNSAGYEVFLDGTVQYKKIDDDKCNGVSDTNKDMRQKTIQMVDSIITKLKDKTAGTLTTEEQTFLNDFPQPVYTILKQAVVMGLTETEKPVLSEYIAKLRAYYLYKDLLSDGYTALDNYYSLLTGSSFDPVTKQGYLESIESQQGKIRELHRVNSDAINKEIQQFQNTMFATLEKLRDVNVVIGDMYKTSGKRKK